jgi:hypothetical protein
MLQDTPISFLESTALCQIPAALSTRLEVVQSRPAVPDRLALNVLVPHLVFQAIPLGRQHGGVDKFGCGCL